MAISRLVLVIAVAALSCAAMAREVPYRSGQRELGPGPTELATNGAALDGAALANP